MLSRVHVEPFTVIEDGQVRVDYLRPDDGARVHAFLDRLLRLVRRLEGRPRRTVVEALRRQERRVRDARRLAGISKALLDACSFRPPPGAARALEARRALFTSRGALWPPLPGDEDAPYDAAAALLGVRAADIAEWIYADQPDARILAGAPRLDGPGMLDRYNLELARAVLHDAVRMTLTARGGWRATFRAVKLARLMYRIERAGRTGRSYRVELTGPAAAFVVKPQRYGVRLARVVPALMRAPGWRLDAELAGDGGAPLSYRLDASTLPVRPPRRRSRFDSGFEASLARQFADRLGAERGGWRLEREATPVAAGDELFLPDFTLRHRDGREALVEIVGFWTPEYLEAKRRKVAAAGLDNLILVVYRGLAAGEAAAGDDAARAEALFGGAAPVLWFRDRPRIGPVLDAAERVAVGPARP